MPVLDASVAVAWVVDQNASAAARALLPAVAGTYVAPAIILVETHYAAAKLALRGRATEAQLNDAIPLVVRFAEIIPLDEDLATIAGRLSLAASLAALTAVAPALRANPTSDWLQWGGPGRNFIAAATGLASSWPAGGPKRLWTRPLGEGHSAILAEGGRVYTMYRPLGAAGRRSQDETVVTRCRDRQDCLGFTYPADRRPGFLAGIVLAPPAIAGDRIYATSTRKELFAIDKASGRRLRSHDFMREYGSGSPGRGYACSPLYNGAIVVSVGGRGQGMAAFDQHTGALVWRRRFRHAVVAADDRRRRAAAAGGRGRPRRRIDRAAAAFCGTCRTRRTGG